jgi:hypothetical protein
VHCVVDVWTKKELDYVFGDEKYLLLHTWRPTIYGVGVGAYPDPVFFKSLVHLANGIGRRQAKILEGHRILEVSNRTGMALCPWAHIIEIDMGSRKANKIVGIQAPHFI